MAELTRPPQDDIKPALRAFLVEKVNNFVKWDLVRFFHDNPHAADTAENIARHTGREVWMIADELRELVTAGVLGQQAISGRTIYVLAADEATRSLIREFVLACDDRGFRVKAIQHVISSMG